MPNRRPALGLPKDPRFQDSLLPLKALSAAALLPATLRPGPALAGPDYRMARPAGSLADWPTMTRCYEIDATQGWQRLSLAVFDTPELLVFDHDTPNLPGERSARPIWLGKTGWTVDAASYAKAGQAGHQGRAAAALDAWSRYKYEPSLPFGTLLARTPDGRLFAVTAERSAPPGRQVLDFRINDADAALGDNDGFLVVCVAERG